MFPDVRQRSKNGEYVERTIEAMILTGTQESSQGRNRSPSNNSDQSEATTTEDGKGKAVETRECDTNGDTRME